MTRETASLAILFADISGSTVLYDKLGDEHASAVVAKCVAIMAAEVPAHQGTLIKTIGDEIMCTFPGAAEALRAACRMQLAVTAAKPGGNIPIYLHIGFHCGNVICEGGDVFGDAVNIAARVAEMTRAREITTTQATVDLLPPDLKSQVRPIFRTGLKGKQEAFDVFRVVWEADDTLSTRVGLSLERRPHEGRAELWLQYQGRSYKLDEQRRSLVLGRGQDCEIMICHNLASRQHARIEYRFGKFVLIDHSVNGSYIRFKDGQVVGLAHEEAILHGAGAISLGQPFSEGPAELVEYQVR
ncbi:MAG: FHA domain-containing protein [Sideroxydans sp.]|nr:FHA domain-containing protein [Sideroxydans sp.]